MSIRKFEAGEEYKHIDTYSLFGDARATSYEIKNKLKEITQENRKLLKNVIDERILNQITRNEYNPAPNGTRSMAVYVLFLESVYFLILSIFWKFSLPGAIFK